MSTICFYKCNKDNSAKRYRRFMNKSRSRVSKELDFQKFILRQRVNTTAVLGLLSCRQSFFVDKMAQMVIKDEGTNTEETSFDDELSDWQRDSVNYAKQLAASTNPTDKRFIDLYLCRKMAAEGVSLGF